MSKKKAKKRPVVPVEEEEEVVEQAYFVEEILDKRLVNKKWEYFLKWKGYGPEDNSWVSVEHMGCPELVQEFERNLKRKQSGTGTSNVGQSGAGVDVDEPPPPSSSLKSMAKRQVEMKPARDPGLQPHKILGAKGSTPDDMMFLLKWKDREEIDWLPSKEVKLMYPQLVINFYEERINWNPN